MSFSGQKLELIWTVNVVMKTRGTGVAAAEVPCKWTVGGAIYRTTLPVDQRLKRV